MQIVLPVVRYERARIMCRGCICGDDLDGDYGFTEETEHALNLKADCAGPMLSPRAVRMHKSLSCHGRRRGTQIKLSRYQNDHDVKHRRE